MLKKFEDTYIRFDTIHDLMRSCSGSCTYFAEATTLVASLSLSFMLNRCTCTLMFDVYHSTAPSYITQLSKRCREVRLRSTARGDYVVHVHAFALPTNSLQWLDQKPGIHCHRVSETLSRSTLSGAT